MSLKVEELMKQKIDIEKGQICDGYNKKSLMGNWYEERWAPEQNFRKDFEKGGQSRAYESDVAYATKKGQLEGLPRINRQPKWNTNGVIPNDGYNEFRSINKTEYDKRNIDNYHNKNVNNVMKVTGQKSIYPENSSLHMNVKTQGTRRMLQESNMGRVIKESGREVYENHTDFGSTLNKHPQNHGQLYTLSEYNGQFSTQSPTQPTGITAGAAKAIRAPLNDIFTKHNPSLQFTPDNANSIPIGPGEYAFRNKETHTAQFRRIRSEITNIPNKPLTKK